MFNSSAENNVYPQDTIKDIESGGIYGFQNWYDG